jgi:hypothetical protein
MPPLAENPLGVPDPEWQEWLSHPVTKALRRYLPAQRMALLEAWADNRITPEDEPVAKGKALCILEIMESCLTPPTPPAR